MKSITSIGDALNQTFIELLACPGALLFYMTPNKITLSFIIIDD
jgi:hypothetical protein